MDCLKMIRARVCYLIEQILSIKILIFLGILALYWNLKLTPDWVFATILGMLVAFREAYNLIQAWRGNTQASTDEKQQ